MVTEPRRRRTKTTARGTADDPPTATAGLAIRRVALAELVPDPTNARTHGDRNRAAIRASLLAHGQVEPLVVQRSTRRVIAGNGRLAEMRALAAMSRDETIRALAKALGKTDVEVLVHPRFAAMTAIGWTDGDVVELDVDDPTARRLGLELNRTGELAGWDPAVLATTIAELEAAGVDPADVGWSTDELASLIASATTPGGGSGSDRPLTPRGKVHDGPASSELGRAYRLGSHVLVCGDARNPATWELLGETTYAAVWTDPPYGVEYESRGRALQHDAIQHDAIQHDTKAEVAPLLEAVLGAAYARTAPGGAWYVTAPPGPPTLVFGLLLSTLPTVWRQGLVWVKDQLVFGRSDRHYQHESIYYGWKEGAAHEWIGGRKRTTILHVDRPKVSDDHPTEKPAELVFECLSCHPLAGRTVLDPFAGSGPVLVVADKLDATAHLVELSPHYCDVIRRRWYAHAVATGQDPGPDALAPAGSEARRSKRSGDEPGPTATAH